MTIAMLMANTLTAACRTAGVKSQFLTQLNRAFRAVLFRF